MARTWWMRQIQLGYGVHVVDMSSALVTSVSMKERKGSEQPASCIRYST